MNRYLVKFSPKICERRGSKIKTKEQDHHQNSLSPIIKIYNEVRESTIVELGLLYGKMLLVRSIENYKIEAYFRSGLVK